jgi:hypothetical protein
MRTPEDAKGLLCPFSRTFGMKEAVAGCRGPNCMLWRYEAITTAHPLWRDAVRAKAEELGERQPFPKAAAWVAENKAALGMVPTRGFCGAGGAP